MVSTRRRIVAIVLVVLATLLAFLAILAIWVNRQLLETDNWTRTSTELLEQPVIRDQIAARLTEEVFSSVDVEGAVAEVLPERAAALAGPAANALRSQVEKTARNALARPDVQALWADANRGAQEQLVALLEGGGDTVSTENGKVVLDVHELLAKLQQEVGVGGRLQKALPASASQITLMESDKLKAAQTGTKVLKGLPVALVIASLVLAGIAMLIAPGWRRNALRALGVGFVVAGLAALLVRSLTGDAVTTSLASTAAAEPSVNAVWVIGTSMLVQVAQATIAYGVTMIFAAWLAGPTAWATAVRRTIAPYWREPAIAYAVLALVIAALVWWEPTPAWRNGPMLAILVVLLAAGTEALRRQVIREFPDASFAEANARRRERLGHALEVTRARSRALGTTAAATAGSAVSASREAASRHLASSGGGEDTRIAELERLARLREAGLLDDAELRAEKARILGGPATDGEHVATT